MRYYSFLPLLLVGSLTGCAVYGGSYGHSVYERSYGPAYEVRRAPVYVAPRYPVRYYDSRRDDYRQPPRHYAPPPPPPRAYRPPMQQGWNSPRYPDRSWGNAFEQRNQHRPPPPPPKQRYDNRRGEVRGWETRR
ncbi:hypothetical protein WG219_14665 [Ectopseudomonas mendocina]|uniref:Lipoprotein n=1 Tax=Ectopseudomonas mendocina TaxID=300 RepID=A0ABZ2RBZ0_ECTME